MNPAQKVFLENEYPKLKRRVDAIVGFSLKLDVDWRTLEPLDGEENEYTETLIVGFFEPLCEVLRELCRDDVGTQCVRQGVRQAALRSGENHELCIRDGAIVLDRPMPQGSDPVSERLAPSRALLGPGTRAAV